MKTPPRTVLVVVTRRIGDVLLATPLLRSLREAWPHAALDVLVFEGTQGGIAANPDIRRVLTVPARPGFLRHLAFMARLLRHYDVALSVLPGDRPTFYAFVAGRWRAGLLELSRKEAWKRPLLHRWIPFDNIGTHTVRMNLTLADLVGAARSGEIVVSWDARDEQAVRGLGADDGRPLAVLHVYPQFNYKMWRAEAWADLARWLDASGFRLALTGGGDADELAHVASIARAMPAGTINAAGKLSLGASACMVNAARVYVGPDTAMTHIAAALGVPTVALYGPSNPIKWGPWPRGQDPGANPWQRCGSQRSGSVILVQGTGACVPCHAEGCDRHVESFSDCLQQLSVERVIAAIRSLTGHLLSVRAFTTTPYDVGGEAAQPADPQAPQIMRQQMRASRDLNQGHQYSQPQPQRQRNEG